VPTDALAVAPVALALVLVVSAVGKLRSPGRSAGAFRDLRVPAPLAHRVVVEGLPWAELALAGLLVCGGGGWGVAAAFAAVLLFAAYLLLVVRALGFDVPVDCACFGELSPGRITPRTVARNAWLLVLAVVSLALAARGASVVGRVADGTAPWWWLLAAAAAGVTSWLIGGGSGTGEAGPAHRTGGGEDREDLDEYVRTPTPAVTVVLADGTETDLRALSAARPQLLLFVSQVCGSCGPVIEAAPRWREQLAPVEVRLVLVSAPGDSPLTSTAEPMTVHDPANRVSVSLGFHATPTAVLLGADGLLAGGPVTGSDAVPAFVEDVRAELAAATDVSVPAGPAGV
jgi:hypothetical protein